MKKSILIFLITSSFLSAQVSIGKDTVEGDALLDFENPTDIGITLPKITTLVAETVPGTLYFDTNTTKVKAILASSAEMDLSVEEVPLEKQYSISTNGYNTLAENNTTTQGVIIGSNTSTAPGVLILESKTKALVLPKVADPHLSIINPEPGTIVYDLTSKKLAVFNGVKWSYWGKN